jgi:hypothetical protein
MPPAPKATHLNTIKLSSEERPSSYMATFLVQREGSYERGDYCTTDVIKFYCLLIIGTVDYRS